jgi:6-phosphogluconolactonase
MKSWITSAALALTLAGAAIAQEAPRGFVYTMSNELAGNRILGFRIGAEGTLVPSTSVATGGLGSGGGLGNQDGLVLSPSGRWLLAVNAGSDEISLLSGRGASPVLLDRVGSGGRRPVSIALRGRLVYVLNAGGAAGDADNITGFRIELGDRLAQIPGSTRALSAASTGPAQISFTPDGDFLVVTERMTNKIVTYELDEEGLTGSPLVQSSAGATPFGFAFAKRGVLLVSEAFGGATDASATSSYRIDDAGTLSVLAASVPTTESAACWVAVTPDGRFAYVTNTGSGTISAYAVGRDGALRLLTPGGVAGNTGAGSGPIDLALTPDGALMFDLRRPLGAIGAFAVQRSGQLRALRGAEGLPTSVSARRGR